MRHTLLITARTYCYGKPPPWPAPPPQQARSQMTALSTPSGDEAAPTAALSPQYARRSRFRGFMICPAWFWWQFRYLNRKKVLSYINVNESSQTWYIIASCWNTWRPGDVCMWTTMMTSSNGNIFRVTGLLCGNSPVTGEFPAQRQVTRSFAVSFDLPE